MDMYLSSVESLQGEKIPFQCPHPMEVPGSPFHCAEFGQHGVGGGNVCFFFFLKWRKRLSVYTYIEREGARQTIRKARLSFHVG